MAKQLRKIFGEELIALHHIGSTSVPGLKAKPIIDIMPVVRDIEVVNKFNDKMIGLGYEPITKSYKVEQGENLIGYIKSHTLPWVATTGVMFKVI
ncbi:MAG: GrpB family protein [Peptococcaceae bacterium]|nr:GrpB family protein [Peptococcaceae bacterium]